MERTRSEAAASASRVAARALRSLKKVSQKPNRSPSASKRTGSRRRRSSKEEPGFGGASPLAPSARAAQRQGRSRTASKTAATKAILSEELAIAAKVEGDAVVEEIRALPAFSKVLVPPVRFEEVATFSGKEATMLIQHLVSQRLERERRTTLSGLALKLATLGPRVLALAEDRLVQPLLTPIVESMLLGREELGVASNDLLDEGLLTVGAAPFEWKDRCIFVSTQGCTSEFKKQTQQVMAAMDSAEAASSAAPLSKFLLVANLHPRGKHEKADDALGLFTHFCFDVPQIWTYLAERGHLQLPRGGLREVLSSERHLLQALRLPLANPAHVAENLCLAPIGFDSSREPKDLASQDIEALLRSVFAWLYVETLELLQAQRGRAGVPEGAEGASSEAALRSLIMSSSGLPARLRYLFGEDAREADLVKLNLDDFLREARAVRRRLVPQAARMHLRNGIATSFSLRAAAARTREALQGNFDLKAVRKGIRRSVSGVRNVHQTVHRFAYLLSVFKPLLCFAYLLFLFFKQDVTLNETLDPKRGQGILAASVQVLLCKKAAQGLIQINVFWRDLWQHSWQGLQGVRQLLVLVGNLLATFLPHSGQAWSFVTDLVKVKLLGDAFGMDTRLTRDALLLASNYLAVLWPFEALWRLGSSLNGALAFSVHQGGSSFTFNMTVAVVLALRGQTLELLLRFLEFMCRAAGYVDCRRKAERYRSLLRIALPVLHFFSLGYTIFMTKSLEFFASQAAEYAQALWTREFTKLFWTQCGLSALTPMKKYSEVQRDLQATDLVPSAKQLVKNIEDLENDLERHAGAPRDSQAVRETLRRLALAVDEAERTHGTVQSLAKRAAEGLAEGASSVSDVGEATALLAQQGAGNYLEKMEFFKDKPFLVEKLGESAGFMGRVAGSSKAMMQQLSAMNVPIAPAMALSTLR